MSLKTPLLAEPVVDLIIEQIKSQFNLLLADAITEYNDKINLEKLADEMIFISDKFENLGMPACYILFGAAAFQYTDNPNYLESEDDVVVVITAQDIGADVLTRKIWRYSRVLFGCLNLVDLVTVDGRLKIKLVPNRLGFTDQITGKLGASQEKKFRQDCVLELKVMHYEKELIT